MTGVQNFWYAPRILPSPSASTEKALANKKERRSRVQAKVGEVLTCETLLARLAEEEKAREHKKRLEIEKENMPIPAPKRKRTTAHPYVESKYFEDDEDEIEEAPQNTQNLEIVTRDDIHVSDFLAIELMDSKTGRKKKFLGHVLSTERSIEVSYLRRLPGGPSDQRCTKFIFPPVPDTADVEVSKVIGRIKSIDIDRRGTIFSVSGYRF